MNLNSYFKSIIDQDTCQIVICDLSHTILYMNPAAIRDYGKRGGAALIGQSLLNCHNPASVEAIQKVVNWFAADPSHNIVHTFYSEQKQKDVYMVALRSDDGTLIGYYEKHAPRAKDESPLYDLG